MIRTAGLALMLTALPALAGADDMTDEELAHLFQSQRDALSATESEHGQARSLGAARALGATRGLRLVAVEDAEAASAPAAEEGVEVAAAADTGVASDVTYAEFAPEYQINVRINFDLDSAALRDDQKPQLDQLCRVMRGSEIEKFRVVGHTDATGPEAYNQRLSRLRAEEVQRYFVTECGIDAARIEALGVGEQFLFDEENPAAGENRRVEFQALS